VKLKVALFKNRDGLFARWIQWQTDSPYCHAALVFNDTILVEARVGKGVVEVPFKPSPVVDLYEIEGLSDEDIGVIWDFTRAQLGKGYDYWGAFRFISRDKLPENDRWFCSELVYAACQAAQLDLLERVEAWQVSPGLLARSPVLKPV
jgi:uncharacterized protein YycO